MSNDKELTRIEWLDKVEKILISGKKDIKAIYNLDQFFAQCSVIEV